MEITKGNAIELGKNSKGWFMGYFMDEPHLRTDELEVQFIDLKKGDSKESTKINSDVKTLTILIKGCFELKFPDENKTIVLREQGDFIKFDLSSKHVGHALEDARILTIKWPSIK